MTTQGCRPETQYYFGYGRNMETEVFKNRVGDVSCHGAGTLEGYRFSLTKLSSKQPYAFANVLPADSTRVEGVVYELTQEQLVPLNRTEGFPNHYGHQEVSIQLRDGDVVQALVYTAQPQFLTDREEDVKCDPRYLGDLIAGTAYHDLPFARDTIVACYNGARERNEGEASRMSAIKIGP